MIGAKSLGAYSGYETFVNKLTEYHQYNKNIKYHVSVKTNDQGAAVPDGAIKNHEGYLYHNADYIEIKIPEKLDPA